MCSYLEQDEAELAKLTSSAVNKLLFMTDQEYEKLDLSRGSED